MKETGLEYALMHFHKKQMVSYIREHPEYFSELIELAVQDKLPCSWRAAWMLWSCMDDNDMRVKGYISKIVKMLPRVKDNQLRELLMVLQRLELSEKIETKLLDFCTELWMKTNKVPSVRYNAFRLMVKVVRKHPALLKEVELLTQPQFMESLSDTVKRCVGRHVGELNKMPLA